MILVAVAVAIFGVALTSIASNGDDTPASVIRTLVAVFVPLAIMGAFWLITRRQVRTATRNLSTRADRDRALVDRVSHQLRDQLTVIYGFSETLLDSELDDRAEVRDVVSVINAEAVDLSRVVDDLVSAAELEAHAFDVASVKFDPAVEIERVVLPFRRQGHTVSIDCWSGLALSDAIRFRQVIRTLVSNAVRHGGPEIAVVGEADGDDFRITVADDGEGIDPALEGGFFEGSVAESALRSGSGTGLGLSVASAIATRLGGRLEYARADGMTMVTLVLPTVGWPERPTPRMAPAGDGEVVAADEDDGTTMDDETASVEDCASPPDPPPAPAPERRISFTEDDHGATQAEADDVDAATIEAAAST